MPEARRLYTYSKQVCWNNVRIGCFSFLFKLFYRTVLQDLHTPTYPTTEKELVRAYPSLFVIQTSKRHSEFSMWYYHLCTTPGTQQLFTFLGLIYKSYSKVSFVQWHFAFSFWQPHSPTHNWGQDHHQAGHTQHHTVGWWSWHSQLSHKMLHCLCHSLQTLAKHT